MMQSLVLLTMAIGFVTLASALNRDEIHVLALGSAGVLSGLWGLATAPSLLQIFVSFLVMGWVYFGFAR